MTNVLLIDDEPLARRVVREYLKDFPELVILGESNDGFEGLKDVRELRPDLIFLDVQMPKINGFEMLELLEEPPAVIFTTAFDEYALKAFEAHAVDYLLKPFSRERFAKAVQKWLGQQQEQARHVQELVNQAKASPSQAERVVVKDGGKIKVIPVQDIQFLEAADDYVKIVTSEGSFLKNKTMAYFEQHLPADRFVRCHRSYMVQVALITRLEPYEKDSYTLRLFNERQLPVSRTGYSKLKEILGL
jgi:two-component system LytT family response regulator